MDPGVPSPSVPERGRASSRVLEFWPDYGQGPLWSAGEVADLARLGLPEPLAERLRAWNGAYDESRLPLGGAGEPGGSGDGGYLRAGAALLRDVREALAGRYRVVATEPWWDEPGGG